MAKTIKFNDFMTGEYKVKEKVKKKKECVMWQE